MNKQDLLSNLQGQSYQNGYVVNDDKPSFVSLNTSIRLGNYIPKPNFKESNNINQLYFKFKEQSNDINSEPIQINVSEGNFDTSVVYKEFFEARRVNLQLQDRQNERLLNQINTMYAPTASTIGELQALRSTRPMLESGIDAIEEYSKSHFLTPIEKQKLREDLIKTNYAKWKANVDGVKDGSIGKDEEKFLSDLPNLPNPSQSKEDERNNDILKYGDLINIKVNLEPTQIRRIAELYLQPFIPVTQNKQKGDFYNYISNKTVSFITMSRLLSLLSNDRQLLEQRISQILNSVKIPIYLTNIIQIINRQVQEKTGKIFINVIADQLKKIVGTNSLQYTKLLDVLFELFKEIRRQIPKQFNGNDLIITANDVITLGSKSNKLNIEIGDLYILSPSLSIYKTNYITIYNQKKNPVIEDIVVDFDEPKEGGAAAGAGGGSEVIDDKIIEEDEPTISEPSTRIKEKLQRSRSQKKPKK